MVRGVVDSFPVFGVVDAYQGFGVERSVTDALVQACGVEAGRSASPETLTSTIEAIVAEFNGALAPQDREWGAIGAVATLAVVRESDVVFRHIGEAGLFLLSEGEISLLTQQHSLVSQLYEEGRLTLEEAASHPQRNLVTRAVEGGGADDWGHGTVALGRGDLMLITTNSLTWALRTPGRVAIDGLGESPSQCIESLLELDVSEPEPGGSTAMAIGRLDS